jgi:hypothetical protein
MTDLEEVPAPEPSKPKRKTYNYRQINALRDGLEDAKRVLRETDEALTRAHAENVELRQRVANQAAFVEAEHQTAEHAVQEAWIARADAAARSSGSVTAAIIIGGFALVIGFVLGRVL